MIRRPSRRRSPARSGWESVRPGAIAVLLLLFIPTSSPAAEPPADRNVAPAPAVATVGDEPITADELRTEMARRGGGVPGQFATPEGRRALLDELIRFEALAARAREAGYDRDPDLRAAFKRLMVEAYLRDQIEAPLAGVEVSDEEVRRFYDEHKDEYARPERRQAAIVFIQVHPNASAEKKAELTARAEAALAEARALDPKVRHFGQVARGHSDDRASRYQGGVIGWLSSDTGASYKWPAEVIEAVMALEEPGEIGPIVRADAGFYLVRLVDREESEARPFELLAAGFRNQILRAKQGRMRQEFLDQILSDLWIEVDEEQLQLIEPPAGARESRAQKRPPPLPPG